MSIEPIRESCEIQASIEVVWNLLTDIKGYESWNPFIVHATTGDSSTQPGSLMYFEVVFPDGSKTTSKERVVAATPPSSQEDGGFRASWSYEFMSWMRTIGMIRATRTQTLEQSPNGPTRYTTTMTVSGWGASGLPAQKVQSGFKAQSEALRAAAEAL